MSVLVVLFPRLGSPFFDFLFHSPQISTLSSYLRSKPIVYRLVIIKLATNGTETSALTVNENDYQLEETTMESAIGISLSRIVKLECDMKKCSDKEKLQELKRRHELERMWHEYLLNKIK